MISFKNIKNQSVFDYVKFIKANDGVILGYELLQDLCYFDKRYDKYIAVAKGTISDGATAAPDIDSFGWIIHDQLCATGKFADGTKCTNLQASMVLSDVLRAEGKWFRQYTWGISTWLLGGGKARINGMF